MNQPDATPAPPAARRRRPSRLPYGLALLTLATLVGAAWLGRGRFDPIVVGRPAPGFAVATMEGDSTTLDAYRGKVVLLNVWATWCAPCREEMPSMQRLYQELAGKDFEIVAVSVDFPVDGGVPTSALKDFVTQMGLTFPILYSAPDSPGDIQRLYQTTGVPESFLIGKDGVVYRRISGPTAWDSSQYREQILRLIEE